jgi:hypothetical protein
VTPHAKNRKNYHPLDNYNISHTIPPPKEGKPCLGLPGKLSPPRAGFASVLVVSCHAGVLGEVEIAATRKSKFQLGLS